MIYRTKLLVRFTSDGPNKRLRRLSSLPNCIFSTECYRRNPRHFAEYAHPHLFDLCVKYGPGDDVPEADLEALLAGPDVGREQMEIVRKEFSELVENDLLMSRVVSPQ